MTTFFFQDLGECYLNDRRVRSRAVKFEDEWSVTRFGEFTGQGVGGRRFEPFGEWEVQ